MKPQNPFMGPGSPDQPAEVRRHLAATPERVFAAFSSAAVVAQWLTLQTTSKR